MNQKKILLIDFCETIVSIQTADDFVFFVLKENKLKHFSLISLKKLLNNRLVFSILNIFGIKTNFKRISVYFLKGIREEILIKKGQEYATTFLVNLINNDVISIIKNNYYSDTKIVVSGGYFYYIKFIMEYLDISIESFLCTIIKVDKNNIITGEIEFDCMGENKVIALRRIGINDSEDNKLVTFTDSISDLPLIKISEKTYFIYENNIRYIISKN